MKAKDYYEAYKADLVSLDDEIGLQAAQDLFLELFHECETVAEMRHVRFDKGFIPILREQNDKYKAINRLFMKEYGWSPLNPDGFALVVNRHFNETLLPVKGGSESKKVDTHTREGLTDA